MLPPRCARWAAAQINRFGCHQDTPPQLHTLLPLRVTPQYLQSAPVPCARGPDPLVVDTLKPACRWGSEVPFHHATQDLHRAVQGSTATRCAAGAMPSAHAPKPMPTVRRSPASSPRRTPPPLPQDCRTPSASAYWNAKTPNSARNEKSFVRRPSISRKRRTGEPLPVR